MSRVQSPFCRSCRLRGRYGGHGPETSSGEVLSWSDSVPRARGRDESYGDERDEVSRVGLHSGGGLNPGPSLPYYVHVRGTFLTSDDKRLVSTARYGTRLTNSHIRVKQKCS